MTRCSIKKSFIFLLLVILLAGCTSTSPFLSEVTLSDEISLEDKLEYYGGKEIYVDEPEMFFSGTEWLERLEKEVSEAEEYILAYTYLGTSTAQMEPLFSLLAKRAEEGVKVYLALDGSSNLDMTETRFVMSPLFHLRESGVNLLVYEPMSFSHILNPSKLLVRDHRKFFVIDGKISVIGGMNLNYISLGAGENNQRDSMYLFHSPSLASMLVDDYVELWNEGSVERISSSLFTTYEGEGEYRAWLFNRNIYKDDVSLAGMYGSLIDEAESEIFFCPYLPVADSNMKESLKRSTDKGVDISFWCSQDPREYLQSGNAWGNADLVGYTGITYYDVTNDKNGEPYPLFHMKNMVVDERYVVIGSSNFNFRSMALSHEMVLVIDSPEIAKEIKEKTIESAKNPVLVTPEEFQRRKKEYGSFFGYLTVFFGG